MPRTKCLAHESEPAVTRCSTCDVSMCGECWQHAWKGDAICRHCAVLLKRPVSPLVPVGGSAIALVFLAQLARGLPFDPLIRWGGSGFAAILIVIAAWRLSRSANRTRLARVIEPRPADAVRIQVRGHPFRGGVRRVGRRIAPPVSGQLAVFVVGVALLVTAWMVPAFLHLPVLMEIEIILGGWWFILSVTLTVLLFKGWRISRDD